VARGNQQRGPRGRPHALPVRSRSHHDGAIDTATWDALIAAANHHDVNRLNYNYVVVSKNLPQTMRLYVDGKLRYSSPVNTGISVAPTQSGTYPVYVRYTTTTMSGNLPTASPTATRHTVGLVLPRR